jgi:D-glycero-D-manno-heptose 1,7-bisphosphate phosphatase
LNKALFLDRDGTILKEVEGETPETLGYLTTVAQVELIDASADAIALARKSGYKIIIITNQSAIARGWLTEEELHNINRKMYDLLLHANPEAKVDDLFYSPYHKDGIIDKFAAEHPSRKPDIGMILEAQEKYDIDLSASYMVGDAYTDVRCGLNAGTKNILVETGYGKIAYKKCLDENLKIDFIASNLYDAVQYIVKSKHSEN